MTRLDEYKAPQLSKRDADARRAVEAFRRLQPTLTSYARILTGRNVTVEMSAETAHTDGHKIYIRPKLELGDLTAHQRYLCDKRDAYKQLLCTACRVREGVLVDTYHEIGHIWFESFAVPGIKREELIEEAIRLYNTAFAKHVKNKINSAAMEWEKRKTYMALAELVSPFLPTLINSLEDARINTQLFSVRHGTRVMFEADEWRIFNEGTEQPDGFGGVKIVKWDKYPLNSQIMAAMYCEWLGYDYSKWFADQIINHMHDKSLLDLITRAKKSTDAKDIYEVSFPILARLRELGYCTMPDEPQEETKNESGEGRSESDESSSGEDNSESSGCGSDEDESTDSTDGSRASDEATEEGQPDSSDGGGSGSTDGGEGENSENGDGGSGGDNTEEPEVSDSEADGQDDTEEDFDGESSASSRDSDSSDDSEGDIDADDSTGSSTEGQSSADQEATEPDGSDSGGSDGTVGEDLHTGESTSDVDSDGNVESGSEAGRGRSASGDESGVQDGSDDLQPDESDSEEADESPEVDMAGRDSDLSRRKDSDDDLGEMADDDSDDSATSSESEADSEPIDTGRDLGLGGIRIETPPPPPSLEYGDPETTKVHVVQWLGHELEMTPSPAEAREEKKQTKALEMAIVQSLYFETPSSHIAMVNEYKYGDRKAGAWKASSHIEPMTPVSESILGPALLRMRVAFNANMRSSEQRHRKSGRVDARVLGKRAPIDDERVFKKKTIPGKRDYFVLIGMDVSGSTLGRNLHIEKMCVLAQAELLSRMGIPFAIFAHSGNSLDVGETSLDIYQIKGPEEAWDANIKKRFAELGSDYMNIDGHTLEYYRKILDRRTETDRIILYYTDGKMPAENYDEELEILRREIQIAKMRRYTLLGVGIRTDSPIRHGLDTVRVDSVEEVVKVVKHLEKRLLEK